MMLDPAIAGLLGHINQSGQPDLSQLPVPVIRQVLRQNSLMMEAPVPDAGVERRDLILRGADGVLPGRLYTPPGVPTPGPCLLFFHGGGFVAGDIDSHDPFCQRMALTAGIRVLSADYRLAPEHVFPAAHDDALSVLRQVLTEGAAWGIDPARVAVGGDSAGANLAVAAVLDVGDDVPFKPLCQILIYPVVDFVAERESRRRLGDGYLLTRASMDHFTNLAFPDPAHRADPRANLLARPCLTAAPSTLLVTAGYDPLSDEGLALVPAYRQAGVAVTHRHYASFIHAFIHMTGISPAIAPALADMAAWLAAAMRVDA